MKKKLILIVLAAALLASAGFGIYRLATYETANHALRLSRRALTTCNSVVTAKAQRAGHISQQEIVVLQSITKTRGQDAVAVFAIYQLPKDANPTAYLRLHAGKIDDLAQIGTLKCRLTANELTAPYNLSAIYTQ